MIYCVKFDEVVNHLRSQGFQRHKQIGETVIFVKDDEDLTFHAPNVNGDVPEALVNDALDNAGLPVPSWTVFWCD